MIKTTPNCHHGCCKCRNVTLTYQSLESRLLYAKGYDMQVAWEHEQFSRLRVTAATLSGLSAPPDLLESTGGLSDNR